MAAYPATPARDSLSTHLLLVHPSHQNFGQLKKLRSSQPMTDLDLFRNTFSAPESLISQWSLSMGNVMYESEKLRSAIDGFNATLFEGMTTYVRLSDPEFPGPEYDVPYSERVALRPKNEEARGAWERLYEKFRQRRMDVCGLDLETWIKPELAGEDASAREQSAPGEDQPAIDQFAEDVGGREVANDHVSDAVLIEGILEDNLLVEESEPDAEAAAAAGL
jgi:hypothetical protein